MNNLYNENEYCMNFSNKEIIEYIIKPINKNYSLKIKLHSENEDNIPYNSKEKIRYICFDEVENFYISFNDYQTAIFILNEEFMFIDDYAKENITSSETYGNVVYEGTLRDKTHKDILSIIYNLIMILEGAKKILIKETKISQTGVQYPKCEYKIYVVKEEILNKTVNFENITFYI